MQSWQHKIIDGFIDTDPAAMNWKGTCEVLCNPGLHWLHLFEADGIVSYFLTISANTDFKILETMPWINAIKT